MSVTSQSTWPTLGDLWPESIAGPAFLTTYTFDAPFFEMRLLPELLRRGAHPVVVLADRHEGYAAALRALSLLDGAGRDYHLIPIDVSDRGGCFHAKVHAFPTADRVVVGSGNLTPGGCGRNLEAFDVLQGTPDRAAIAEAHAFIARVLALEGAGIDPEDRRAFEDMLILGAAVASEGVQFAHTLDGPLLPQLQELLTELPVEEALLVAPFHDLDHHTSLELAQKFGARRLDVVAEAAATWSGPTGTEGCVIQGENRRIRSKEAKARPLHAKVVHARGELHALTVVGSANLTRAAWKAHNLEAVVTRRALSPTAYDDFRGAVEIGPDDWYEPPGRTTPDPEAPAVPVRWARLEGSSLRVGMPHLDAPTFTLSTSCGREVLALGEVEDGYTGVIETIDARALVLWVGAAGYRPAGVVVTQPGLLSTTGRAGRVRRLLQRIEAGLADDTDRRELVSCLADVLGALQRGGGNRTRSSSTGRPTPATASAGRFHGDSDEAIVAAVADLPFHARGRAGDLTHAVSRLGHLVDLLVRRRSSEAEREEDQHERSREAEEHVASSRSMAPDHHALAVDIARIVDQQAPLLANTAAFDIDRAALVHLTVRRLLHRAVQEWPGAAGMLAQKQIEWMAASWPVADWPDEPESWAVRRGLERDERAYEALAVAWSGLPAQAQGGAVMDLAHRVVVGLDQASEGAPPDRGALDPLRQHETRGERAQKTVAPLWDLERGWLGRHRERALFDEAHARARTLDDPWLGSSSLYALWRSARDMEGRRVFRLASPEYCPACHTTLPVQMRERARDPSQVTRCRCGVLLAHDLPQEVRHD